MIQNDIIVKLLHIIGDQLALDFDDLSNEGLSDTEVTYCKEILAEKFTSLEK